MRWKVVDGWPGYEVSDMGKVRRRLPAPGARVGKILKTSLSSGYPAVNFSDYGRRKTTRVHLLVLRAFIGPPPTPAHEAGHVDDNKMNARLSNLRWVTRPENIADRVRNGKGGRGERSGTAKLTNAQVLEIRRRKALGAVSRQMAVEFGVVPQTIDAIVNRTKWAHI